MHGFTLDVVIDAEHDDASDLAADIAQIVATHDDVRSITITVRCNTEPAADDGPSILD